MALRIDTVCTRRDMRDFLRVPWDVYKDDPVWVPPLEREIRRTLDPARNPYYRSATLRLFVARRDAVPVARVAVSISSAHAARWGESAAFFGFFECTHDREVARALFTEVERYSAEQGATAIEGPFNPCHYSELGMQCDAYDQEQRFFMTHNPPWYNDLLADCGYHVSSRKYTMRNANVRAYAVAGAPAPDAEPPAHGYTVRCFDARHRTRELERMREVFNDAFYDNWHFLASSREEFLAGSAMLEYVTDPDLVLMLEYDGEVVGVCLLAYDINPMLQRMRGRVRPLPFLFWHRRKRRIRHLILYAGGIRRDHRRGRGSALLLQETMRVASRFDTFEATWMSEENRLARGVAVRMGMEEDRHFLIYRREIPS